MTLDARIPLQVKQRNGLEPECDRQDYQATTIHSLSGVLGSLHDHIQKSEKQSQSERDKHIFQLLQQSYTMNKRIMKQNKRCCGAFFLPEVKKCGLE
jgi:hypothetical protein